MGWRLLFDDIAVFQGCSEFFIYIKAADAGGRDIDADGSEPDRPACLQNII